MKPVLRPIDILRTGIILAILGAILIGLNFFPKHEMRYWDSTEPVEPNSFKKAGIGFIPRDHIFVGSVSVGEVFLEFDDRKISVSIEDSSANIVFAPVLANGSYRFVFQAPKDDFYYFHFDNTNSSVGSSNQDYKMVFWQIWYYGNYTLVFQILASIFWTSGILCIGLYLFKGKKPEIKIKDIPDLAEEIIKKILKSTKR